MTSINTNPQPVHHVGSGPGVDTMPATSNVSAAGNITADALPPVMSSTTETQVSAVVDANGAPMLPAINEDLIPLNAELSELLHQLVNKTDGATVKSMIALMNSALVDLGIELTYVDDAIFIGSITVKTAAANLETQLNAMKLNQEKVKKLGRDAIEKIKIDADKYREAVRKAKESAKWGLVTKIAGFVAAVAVIAATGGTAGPIVMALMVTALAGSGVALAGDVSKHAGGPGFSVAEGFEKLGAMIDKDNAKLIGGAFALAMGGVAFDPACAGMFAEGAADAAGASARTQMICAIVTTIVVGVAMSVIGGKLDANAAAKVAAADKAAQASRLAAEGAEQGSEAAEQAANIASALDKLASGATTPPPNAKLFALIMKMVVGGMTIGSGVAAMESAKADFERDLAAIEKQMGKIFSDFLAAEFADKKATVEDVMKVIEDALGAMATFLQSHAQGSSMVAMNFG